MKVNLSSVLLLSLSISCFLYSCNDVIPPEGFLDSGCRVKEEEQTGNGKKDILKVNVFLETSGSMFGFMPANDVTIFQKDMWDIIASLRAKGDGISTYQVKDTKTPLNLMDVNTFHQKMNSGEFQVVTSTDIPAMLDSVLARTKGNSVSVLISDLIFSPDNSGNVAPKLAQITTDIRTRFEGKGLSSSIFFFTSNFKGRSVNPEKSPYYVWVIGNESAVLKTSAIIRKSFPSVEQINFGIKPLRLSGTIVPSILPAANALPVLCSNEKRYYTWSEYTGEELEFYIAVDLSSLPKYAREKNYLQKHLAIKANQAEVSLTGIETDFSRIKLPASDVALMNSVNATHLVKIKLSNAYDEETLIQIDLISSPPGWVNTVNSEADDLSRTKTFGFSNMIKGLEEAYSESDSGLLTEPLKIWISKNTID